MGRRYVEHGAQSRLAEIPLAGDVKEALKVVQQNQDTIWKAIGELRNRIDNIK